MRAWVLAFGLIGCGGADPLPPPAPTQPVLTGPVDILLVMDEGPGMGIPQGRLLAEIGLLEDALATVDFHLGVVSTTMDSDDPDAPQLVGSPPFLVNGDDVAGGLEERAALGEAGPSCSSGYNAARLVRDVDADGFHRSDAAQLILLVSNADDCTSGSVLDPIADVVNALGDAVITGFLNRGGCYATASDRYAAGAALTSGEVWDLCDDDWSLELEELGERAAAL